MDHGIDDILARNYLDQALDQVSDGVAIFDADDRLIMSNENYKSLYGKHREIVVPGATFDALIRASVALGLTPHSGIDGDDYSELRLRDFKARKGAEFQTFDGRLIEASEHPLADGGVAHICVDVTRHRHAEESREHAEILRQHAERIAHLGSWEIDYSSDQVKWSDEVYRVLGLDRESFDGRQESFLELGHPDDRLLVRKQREDIADGRPYDYTYRIIRPDGSERMVHVGGEVIRAVGGNPELARGFIHDITERKQAEDALRESKERLDEAQRIAQVGSFTRDFHGDVNHWSDEHYRIFGVEPLGKKISQAEFMALVHPGDRESVAEAVRQAIELHKPYDLEHQIVRPDGAVHIVHGRGEVTFGEDRKPLSLRGTVQDITERREAEQQVRYLAHHDALTDLPTRHLFEDRLEKAMAIATRHDQHVAVHFIDLNRFKQVNDALGHAVGDELLKAVGTVLKGVVRATDTLARFGGDEFTVIQTELVDPRDAAILAQKLLMR